MNTTRGITLTALALLLGACQDGPTVPEVTPDDTLAEAQAELALDGALAEATAMFDQTCQALPDGRVPQGRAEMQRRGPRHQRPERGQPAELAVALGAEAVALATRLLDENGADQEQLRFLEQAESLLRAAEAALDQGREPAAVQLAHAASHAALKAVVLPGGVTDEEARMIHDLAAGLLGQAREAVAADPTDIEVALLELAERMFEHGSAALENGAVRGLVALWRSATLSAYLIG